MATLNVPAHEGQAAEPAEPAERRSKCFNDVYCVTDEVLGRGMNGEVKLAVHRETGQKVALKRYRVDSMEQRELMDLVREVEIQSSLRHPNVASVECVYQSKKCIRLLVEHLSGGAVFEHVLEEGPLGEREATRVLRQLLSAVEYLHAEGLVHRDIKPENLVYTDDEKDAVKLIDFGFCCAWEEGNKPMTRRCGTEAYMAPEVTMKAGYTNMADMWSVGVVAHVLLTSELPGRRSDWTPVLSDRLAGYSLEAQKFVGALLVLDQDKRLTAQQALRHPWLVQQSGRKARCDSSDTASTAAYPTATTASASSTEDFLALVPHSEASAPKKERRSIWQALPSFGLGAGGRVAAALSAVRGFKSRRASHVSVEMDI